MSHTIELQIKNLNGSKESIVLYGIRSAQDNEQISSQLKEYGYKTGTLYKIVKIHD